MILNDEKAIMKLDPEDMYHKIIRLPQQLIEGYSSGAIHNPVEIDQEDSPTRIILCGMGGSAISGDIVRHSFWDTVPIEVVKQYEPPFVDQNTLLIAVSYSGNTEETLTCFEAARQKAGWLGAVTSGGTLRELAGDSIPWVRLPEGFPPRSAVGYLTFGLIRLLEHYKVIPDQTTAVNRLIGSLVKKAGALAVDLPAEQNIAKTSAQALQGRIPVIYATHPLMAPLAYRWKCQVNENAKYPAFWHVFPEMNHNEIEGWERGRLGDHIAPVLLSRMPFGGMTPYRKRAEVFKKILSDRKIPYQEFFTEGETLLEEMFTLIYLGDMISYYLAVLEDVNPTSIDLIHAFKKALSEQ